MKKGVKYWKPKAWDQFSKYIRLRDALETTGTTEYLRCCSCGKVIPAFESQDDERDPAQAGHFVPGRTNSLLFDEQGVHGQCKRCNSFLNGNWVNYERFMLKKYGREITEKCKARKFETVKFSPAELEEKRDHYKQKYEELLKEN